MEKNGKPGDLTIARRAPYLLRYIRHYNKHPECYVIYEVGCTSSLIQTYRHGSWHSGFCYEADSHNKEDTISQNYVNFRLKTFAANLNLWTTIDALKDAINFIIARMLKPVRWIDLKEG